MEIGESQAFLRTPSYIIGFPSYDRLRATVYLKRQLELGKFDVTKMSDIDLYVSWKRKKGSSKHRGLESESKPESEDDVFPTLMNLKKAAAKYRN